MIGTKCMNTPVVLLPGGFSAFNSPVAVLTSLSRSMTRSFFNLYFRRFSALISDIKLLVNRATYRVSSSSARAAESKGYISTSNRRICALCFHLDTACFNDCVHQFWRQIAGICCHDRLPYSTIWFWQLGFGPQVISLHALTGLRHHCIAKFRKCVDSDVLPECA